MHNLSSMFCLSWSHPFDDRYLSFLMLLCSEPRSRTAIAWKVLVTPLARPHSSQKQPQSKTAVVRSLRLERMQRNVLEAKSMKTALGQSKQCTWYVPIKLKKFQKKVEKGENHNKKACSYKNRAGAQRTLSHSVVEQQCQPAHGKRGRPSRPDRRERCKPKRSGKNKVRPPFYAWDL
jgi:hypothetical protein